MPTDQLRAEIVLVYKRNLAETLTAQMKVFFPGQSADAVICASGTALANRTKSLKLSVFARDHDQTVFHYFLEDARSLKVHVESRHSKTLQNKTEDAKKFEEIISREIKQMRLFSKINHYRTASVHVAVSINDTQIGRAEQKAFWRRFVDIWTGTSNISKLTGVIATGLAAYVYNTDPATFGKAILAGISAIFISAAFEAACAETFKFQWN